MRCKKRLKKTERKEERKKSKITKNLAGSGCIVRPTSAYRGDLQRETRESLMMKFPMNLIHNRHEALGQIKQHMTGYTSERNGKTGFYCYFGFLACLYHNCNISCD